MTDSETSTDERPAPIQSEARVGRGRVMSSDETSDTGPSEEGLDRIAEMVRSAAAATAQLWRESGLDGDLTARLIEVSQALHRAALALADVGLIGGADSEGHVPWLAPPQPGDLTTKIRAGRR